MAEKYHKVEHVSVEKDVEVSSIKKKKIQKLVVLHAKTNCKINSLASEDKKLEES